MAAWPITEVVVCPGGLRTRVAPRARHIPKEFMQLPDSYAFPRRGRIITSAAGL